MRAKVKESRFFEWNCPRCGQSDGGQIRAGVSPVKLKCSFCGMVYLEDPGKKVFNSLKKVFPADVRDWHLKRKLVMDNLVKPLLSKVNSREAENNAVKSRT